MKQPKSVRIARPASMRPCKKAKPIAATAMVATAVATDPVSAAAIQCVAVESEESDGAVTPHKVGPQNEETINAEGAAPQAAPRPLSRVHANNLGHLFLTTKRRSLADYTPLSLLNQAGCCEAVSPA
jgi:hypothetical protein